MCDIDLSQLITPSPRQAPQPASCKLVEGQPHLSITKFERIRPNCRQKLWRRSPAMTEALERGTTPRRTTSGRSGRPSWARFARARSPGKGPGSRHSCGRSAETSPPRKSARPARAGAPAWRGFPTTRRAGVRSAAPRTGARALPWPQRRDVTISKDGTWRTTLRPISCCVLLHGLFGRRGTSTWAPSFAGLGLHPRRGAQALDPFVIALHPVAPQGVAAVQDASRERE